MSTIQSVILAIVEGLTEFLPISSTGHMIIVSSLMGIADDEFTKTFIVAIQLGAIFSVFVVYIKRFFISFSFYYKLFIAFLPAAVIGLLLHDYINKLLNRVDVVAITLIIGGIIFLFVDNIFSRNTADTENEMSYSTALKVGFFQTLAMVPGVSRSGATIIGGLSQGLSKKTAAEFSFFLAVPTMLAATAYKLLTFYLAGGEDFRPKEITLLLVGNVIAFVTALFAIKSFIAFLMRYGFKFFGYYRILLGSIIFILYYFDIGRSTL